MQTIAIKLDPARMKNPDLDIRYKIPELLSEATSGDVRDDGYGYVDGDKLAIFMTIESPKSVHTILALLEAEEICGNRVLESGIVAIDSGGGFEVIHPKDFTGDLALE